MTSLYEVLKVVLAKHYEVAINLSSNNSDSNTKFETLPHRFGARVALGYAGHFLVLGLLLPYFPVWLQSVDLSAKEIGIILFIPLVARVFTSGRVTSFADRQKDRSNVITALFVCSALSVILFAFVSGFYAILMVTLVFYFFFNPIMPMMDVLTLAGVRRFDTDYGRIRIWGSVIFVFTNFGGGVLLATYQPEILIYVIIYSTILAAILSFALPRIGRSPKRPEQTIKHSKAPNFWKHKHFVLVLLAAGLVQASHAMLYGFGSIYWRDIGFSGTFIGMLWAVGVVAEIILFQYSTKILKSFSPIQFIFIGAVGAFIRWALFPYLESQTEIFILQILHAISFGAVHIGTMHFIMRSVPEEHIGTGQGVGFVLGGLAMGFLLLISGTLYEALYAEAFGVMALVSLLAILILFFANKYQPHNNGDGGVTKEEG